jgi:hypothetical protein
LGLAGYYRKFIRDFGIIVSPLTRLLHRDAFAWDDEATAAFEALKGALTTGPVLQMPDFDRPFIVDCDTSGAGFGAVFTRATAPSPTSAGPSPHVTSSWRHTSRSS